MRFGVVVEDSTGIRPDVVLVANTRMDGAINCAKAHLGDCKKAIFLSLSCHQNNSYNTWPPIIVLAFLKSGRKFIHGGHQGAKKSMMTGWPLVITSGKSEATRVSIVLA